MKEKNLLIDVSVPFEWYSTHASCPYTPEHMGLVERKHQHVVETSLALLATSSLPKTFSVEAFQTTVYLINNMPTKVLDNSFLKIFG